MTRAASPGRRSPSAWGAGALVGARRLAWAALAQRGAAAGRSRRAALARAALARRGRLTHSSRAVVPRLERL
jgi:hypothetical protein